MVRVHYHCRLITTWCTLADGDDDNNSKSHYYGTASYRQDIADAAELELTSLEAAGTFQ